MGEVFYRVRKLGKAWELIWRDALLPDDRKSRW
jgi:hypothetical protein